MDTKAWVKQWEETGRRLEEIRLLELRSTDTAAAILAFAGLDVRAAELYPPPPTSGLVEMQKLFKRLRTK